MAAVVQYPEFIAAIILALVFFLGPGEEKRLSWRWFISPARLLLQQLPAGYLVWVNRALMYADRRTNLALAEFASGKLSLSLLSLISAAFYPLHIALPIAIVSYFIPDLFLTISVSKRQAEIRKALPQALDLMVLCVDAGLGLDATLQRISSDSAGLPTALNDELKILGREIMLGMDREKAYQDLFERTGVDELKTLGSALHQASKLGLSVAKILRAQSEFIAKKHSQNAEEGAMKMPIYMAFPLWFFIMPSLMLLVLGPSLLRFYHQLHAGSAGQF